MIAHRVWVVTAQVPAAVSEQNEQLLRRAYEAFNARDIENALATMRVDVDWSNGMDGGRVHGHQGVREYWERQFRLIDSRLELESIEDTHDGRTVVTVRQLVRDRAGNIVSDEQVEHHYVITGGLIRRMDIQGR